MRAQDAIARREARLRERNRPTPTQWELRAMLKADLVALAEVRGASTAGTRAEPIERLGG